jgi:signal transduction histidine kinase
MHAPGDPAVFPRFTEEQLEELKPYGTERRYGEGESVFDDGDTVDSFYVVLEGRVRIQRGKENIVTHTPGEFTGGLSVITGLGSRHRATAVAGSRILEIPAGSFRRLQSERPDLGEVFISTLGRRMRESQAWIRQQEKLAALGKLSAGLAHELNNPAAAAKRAAAELKAETARVQKTALNHDERFTGEQRTRLGALLDKAAGGPPVVLDTLERGDREDEVALWLEDRGVEEAWDLSPTLVSSGLGVEQLEALADEMEGEVFAEAVSWLGGTLGLQALAGEVYGSVGRISQLVRAMKAYSHMDREAMAEVDVREGLESTLTILGHKLKVRGIAVEREYEDDLPRVCAHGGELNQVWTNLIDNAVDAMEGQEGEGTLGVRARGDGDGHVIVEISDTGSGIPREIKSRIFEPFFTTKGVGSGTGLGLDIVRRIVVEGHGGDVRVDSEPGQTRFLVRLPVEARERRA